MNDGKGKQGRVNKMTGDIFDLFFDDGAPALLCVRGSCVAAVNAAASRLFNRSAEGERLSDYMPPLDVLRFQAAFESRSYKPLLSIKLDNYLGCYGAAAAFRRIVSRRFAVVLLFKKSEDCDAFCTRFNEVQSAEADLGDLPRFISLLTSIPKNMLEDGDRYGLLDLRAATRRCIDDIQKYCGNIDCQVDITENDSMAARVCSPVAVPLGCFMQMLSSMLLCMNEISQNRIIGVRLCGYGDECELRMSADAMRLGVNARDIDSLKKELPSSAVYLSIGEFAAGACGCTLSLRRSEDAESVTLILSFSRDFGSVDFKSRDQFAYYNEAFDYVSKQLNRLITPRTKEAPKAE